MAAPYFAVEMFETRERLHLATRDDSGKHSVQILVAVEGCGVIEVPGGEAITLAKGDAVVIPACLEEFAVRPQWNLEILRAYVPGKAVSGARDKTLVLDFSSAIYWFSRNWYHFEERIQFLSRDSGRWTGHAILAAQPQEASETVAGARRQADHDPTNGGAFAAARISPEILDHHQ